MPIYLHQYLEPEGELGIWRIAESEDWFRRHLRLEPAEEAQLAQITGRRRTEWLAARWLVHYMSGREQRGVFLKDEFGKPHLEGSKWQIAISHSDELAAAIAAPEAAGVDIQRIVAKIDVIAQRFMREEEMEELHPDTRLEEIHVYWGAKECLYKAYGRRQLDFCANLLVHPFTYRPAGGLCRGEVRKEDYHAFFDIHYQRLGDYMLVYARQKKR